MYKLSGLDNRILECIPDISALPKSNNENDYVKSTECFFVESTDFPVLTLPKCEKPEVSIIIPVYNQFEYTYRCIRSIIANTTGVDYEVLIADDKSTDETKNIGQIIENIVLVRSEQNVRFLINCNNAARKAKGEYIFFLNNDTLVCKDWLTSIVNLVRNNPDIGMAGSKLVYPNGLLQEAGGIVWKDATAYNFGNSLNPDWPLFRYIKDVDYISGAAVLIRKSLWELIGGFDVRFAPAYYEDTDLAFAVRKQGYHVVLQPRSVVIHYEGVSNGKQILSRLKEFQIVNEGKFYKKWKTILKDSHYPDGKHVYFAKDLSGDKVKVLILDEKGKELKKLITKLEHKLLLDVKVVYAITECAIDWSEVDQLGQRGVETIIINNYDCDWLRKQGKLFDYIYVSRENEDGNKILKGYDKGNIIYDLDEFDSIWGKK